VEIDKKIGHMSTIKMVVKKTLIKMDMCVNLGLVLP
jgi:hypothetical protein